MKKMRAWLLIALILVIHLCISISVCNVSASAEGENSEAEELVGESVLDLIGELDLKALQEYVDELGAFSGESVSQRLIDYIKGESFDYENFGKELVGVLFENVRELLPAFSCIAAIALLSGLISTLKSGTASGAAGNMIFLISYAAALIPLVGVLIECFEKTFESVSQMQRQMQIVYPLLLTLMAASGGVLSVAMCRPAVAFFSNTSVSLITSVVFPSPL